LLGVLMVALVLFTKHTWIEDGIVDVMLETLGFFLVMTAAFGRIWCSLYISGYKTKLLITDGPYSMVRNPLYFCSLLGVIGLGLAAESFLLAAILALLFFIYYPLVIHEEEKKLLQIHGNDFHEYMLKTPCLIPKLSLLKEPVTYVVDVRRFRKSFFDAMWFVWIFGLLQVVERLHETSQIPVVFQIP
jgi:protein-S-isoprenylcysteine O-methyltransferase Ste14